MRTIQLSSMFALIFLANCLSAQAECPPWRPCGPGSPAGGNRLIPQGFYGADFRPACAAHDACYTGSGFSRSECDRQFLCNMQAACDCSSNPRACYRKARFYYNTARLFGGSMYR